MKLRTTIIYLFPMLLIATACGNHKESTETFSVSKVIAEKAVLYDGSLSLSYTGVVEEKKNIHLSFLAAGTITDIAVHEGQEIRKGTLLARINAESANNYYQIALLQEQKARDAYNRLKPMNDNGTIPPIKMVEAETGLKQAIANTKIAQKTLDDNKLFAPASGIIGKIHLTQGMNAGPGVIVLDILDISTVYVKTPVPEDEIIRIKLGKTALVDIPAIQQKSNGVVKEIGITADLLSHTYPVKIELNNAGLLIKPGMVCSVTVGSDSNKTGFLISAKTLQKDVQGNQYVFVVDEQNRVNKVLVQTTSLINDKVLVSGNLTANSFVVVSGQEKLKPQMKVNIIHITD